MGALIVFLAGLLGFHALFRAAGPLQARFGARASQAIVLVAAFAMVAASLWALCTPWTLVAMGAAAALAARGRYGDLDALSERLGRYRLPIFVASVFGIALLVLVAMPITTFLTSPGELDIHLDRMLRVNGRNVMVVVYAALALYSVAFFGGARTVLALLAAGAFFLCWTYAFVLPLGYPMMSGLAFEQLPMPAGWIALRAIADVALVLALGFCLHGALRRWGARPLFGALLLANLSIGIATLISAGRGHEEEGGVAAEAEFERPLRLSSTRPNVLYIFLDRFMGSYVESILEAEPALASRLEGFTWYPRSVSAGENSIAGVHPMLGGYDYLPVEMNGRGRPLRELSVEAFSILPYNFARHGYRVSVLSPRGMGFTMMGDCQFLEIEGVDCSHIPASISRDKAMGMGFSLNRLAESNYADLLVLLASMRVTPYLMKEAIYARGPWRPFLDHSAGTTFREWAELGALDQLTEVDAGPPAFNFVSNILPHEPYFLGQDCVPLQQRPVVGKEEMARRGHGSFFSMQHALAARCSLLMVADYMDFLKAQGVYANTTVVVVSDHGIVGDVEDRSSRAVAGKTTENAFVSLRPLVMVKRAGASGALRVAEDFMPNAEVPRIVCEQIGGCVNPYLDDRPVQALGRDDPFPVSLVPWQFSEQDAEAFVIKEQLVLRGRDPFVRSNWARVAREKAK